MSLSGLKINYSQLYRQFSQRSSLFIDYPDRLNCTLCNKIMIEPIQTECGCRFCLKCIWNYIEKGEVRCPTCDGWNIEQDKLLEDKAVEKEIMNLDMKCINEGCPETLLLRNLNDHLEKCEYRSEECRECQQRYLCIKKKEHIMEVCDKSVIVCDDCGDQMTREDLRSKHRDYVNDPENICRSWVRDCPYKCNEEKLFSLRIHLRNCSNKPMECSFHQIGCRVKKSRQSMKFHMEKDRLNHDVLLMTQLNELIKENTELKKTFAENEEKLKLQIQKSQEQCCRTSDDLKKLTEKLEEVEVINKSLVSYFETKKQKSGGTEFDPYKDIVVVNGQATWTIKNIREKIKESSSRGNDNSQIVSETFYVGRPGYLLSLKIYPNGDGRARNKSLSIFFVINKGGYDTELKWPFQSKVTLTLLSGNQSREDIVVHMKPDNNPGCYGRPLSSHNIGAGQPDFVTLTDIIDTDCFLHNGALKVRLSIS